MMAMSEVCLHDSRHRHWLKKWFWLIGLTVSSSGSATARRNLRAGLRALRKAGIDPAQSDSVIDLGAGYSFGTVTTDMVATLTRSRASQRAYWLTKAFCFCEWWFKVVCAWLCLVLSCWLVLHVVCAPDLSSLSLLCLARLTGDSLQRKWLGCRGSRPETSLGRRHLHRSQRKVHRWGTVCLFQCWKKPFVLWWWLPTLCNLDLPWFAI